MRKIWLVVVALVATLVATIGGPVLGRATPVASASPAPLALGVWAPRVPWEWNNLDQYTSQAGKAPAIVMWYHDWVHGGFYRAGMDQIAARGAVPMVTWEPQDYTQGINQPAFALSTIAAGAHDTYIRQYARDAAAWGQPFYLRFGHEMNGDWYPWAAGVNGNTAADYVAAWRHIYTIFQQEGATNVQWVWSPNYDYPGLTPLASLYPGDAYVNWVALDGYNRGTALPGAGWQSMASIFGPSYATLTALTSKPMMIAETGSAEAGGDKAAWITQSFLNDIPTRFPRVRAVLWFNENAPDATDWRIDTSPRSLAAYRAVATDPLYAAPAPLTASTPPPAPAAAPAPAPVSAPAPAPVVAPAPPAPAPAAPPAVPTPPIADAVTAPDLSAWSAWQDHGGRLVTAPAATNFQGRVAVFAVGADAALYVAQGAPGQPLGGWTSLGGVLTSTPAVTVFQDRLVVVARGQNNELYLTSSADGRGFTPWRSLGGQLVEDPAIAVAQGQLVIYAVGTDRALYVSVSPNGQDFNGWNSRGGYLTAAPAVTVAGNQLALLARGADSALYLTTAADGVSFGPWQNLGGVLTAAPAATAVTPAGGSPTLVLFVRGADGALYTATLPAGASGVAWTNLGGQMTGAPAATSVDGQVVAFVRDASNTLRSRATLP